MVLDLIAAFLFGAFLVGSFLAPLAWVATLYDMDRAAEWAPWLKRSFLTIVLGLMIIGGSATAVFAIEIPNRDYCALIDSSYLLWWLIPCW